MRFYCLLASLAFLIYSPIEAIQQTDFRAYWRCENVDCNELNENDYSEGCAGCKMREEEAQQARNDYYRDILDVEDPSGAPHSFEEAEEFAKRFDK